MAAQKKPAPGKTLKAQPVPTSPTYKATLVPRSSYIKPAKVVAVGKKKSAPNAPKMKRI